MFPSLGRGSILPGFEGESTDLEAGAMGTELDPEVVRLLGLQY